MKKEEFRIYYNHTIGFTLLGNWCQKHKIPLENNIIKIPLNKSNLFCAGIPTGYKDKNIFIACEREEISWFRRILWNRMILDKFNKKIVFISQRIEGDKENLPDITEIALEIPYENAKKAFLFEVQKKVSLKEFYIDNGLIIVGKTKFFTIPIVIKENQEDGYFTRLEGKKYTTHKDLLNGNITKTNVFKTEYKGEVVNTFVDSKLNYLTKGFNEKNFEGMSEYSIEKIPESYKEFINKDYNYEADWIKERNKNNQKVNGKRENIEKINEDIINRWG